MKSIEKYKSRSIIPPAGTPCITTNQIIPAKECRYFNVTKNHIDARQPNKKGITDNWVPGGGGDIWWVIHEDRTIGAYLSTEVTDLI